MDVDKLGKVAGVANSATQKSALEFKATQQAHREKCDQLEQLQQFKREYEAQLQSIGVQGMAARQLQDYRLFLGKLNQAIDEQTRDIHSAQQRLGDAREDWIARTRRSSALDQAMDHELLRQRQSRDKAEQREADEKSMARSSGNYES
ncbi:MAG: flagellar export protein FliJ [Halioglobus sp.]|nr:flagellar export protein FliJ [Halioglobus sp.]